MTNIAETFELCQNYPNPFNPTTTIQYKLPEASFVTLKVYNVIGEEIKTLVSEYQSPGQHNVMFDASELSNGVYFYRIKSGQYTDMKKMILTK